MKGWQAILIAAATVIGLTIAVALALPRHFRIERSAVIAAPIEAVWAQLADVRAHEKWAPWLAGDEDTTVTFGPSTTGDGASYQWTSQDSGSGEFTVSLVDPPRRLEYEVVFSTTGKASGWFQAAPEGEATRLTWRFEGSSEGPLGGLVSMMMDRLVGQAFDQGLSNLTALAEAASPPQPVSEDPSAGSGVGGTDPGGALPPIP